MLTVVTFILSAAIVCLPLVIRGTKKVYRSVILLWAKEVQKAWNE